VLWGASGFTGQLTAEYLGERYGVNQSLRWAVAGRKREKLAEVLQTIGHPTVPILWGDSFDKQSLLDIASQTTTICSTVGPYTKYGSLLVEACVEAGTHYCDLTGEAGWVREMIDRHHLQAESKQLKIVHCCGFDSIPSDMGVFFLQKEAKARWGQYVTHIHNFLKTAKGGLSGGTFASLMELLDKANQDRSYAHLISKPYTLNPDPNYAGPDARDLQSVVYIAIAESWIAPFIMASINTRVVRRSHALLGFPYGQSFRYDEAMLMGKGWKGLMRGLLLLAVLATVLYGGKTLRKILARFMPKPGEGPSPEERASGFFYFILYGTLPNSKIIRAKVKGDRDPGYGSTSKMLAECAVCLALDRENLTKNFGVLTPSAAMGEALLGRLTAHAGLSFEMVDEGR
jgi:short subunit dehydrogenase-like uncharacterized protein